MYQLITLPRPLTASVHANHGCTFGASRNLFPPLAQHEGTWTTAPMSTRDCHPPFCRSWHVGAVRAQAHTAIATVCNCGEHSVQTQGCYEVPCELNAHRTPRVWKAHGPSLPAQTDKRRQTNRQTSVSGGLVVRLRRQVAHIFQSADTWGWRSSAQLSSSSRRGHLFLSPVRYLVLYPTNCNHFRTWVCIMCTLRGSRPRGSISA